MTDSATTTSGSIYLCVKQFNARLGDELNLKIGDKVEVLADDSEYNDGWYMGRNLLNNEVGLYPKTFTQLLHTPKNKNPLLRSRSRRINSPGGLHGAASSSSVNKIADALNDLSVDSNSNTTSNGGKDATGTSSANTTMSEIDKALKELQDSPIASSKSKVSAKGIPGYLNGSAGLTPGLSSFSKPALSSSNSVKSSNKNLILSEAYNWSPEQVSTYFGNVRGFDTLIANNFARHKITGAILFELDLAHLKEIDIDSFGTRFEIYKEIENLKKLSGTGPTNESTAASSSSILNAPQLDLPIKSFHYDKSINSLGSKISSEESGLYASTQLMPSATLTLTENGAGRARSSSKVDIYVKEHQRKRSQSLDDILIRPHALNLQTTPQGAHRGDSQSPSTTPNNKEDNRRSMAFLSPRRAPVPPSQPSPLNKQYKFGGGLQNEDNIGGHMYVTRSNAAGLGISGLSRPTSSIYDNSILSHSRKESLSSQNGITNPGIGHHRRNSSAVSGMRSGPQHHRRHSSLFLFLSTNEDLSLTGEKTPKQNGSSNQNNGNIGNNGHSSAAIFNSNRNSMFLPEDGDYFKPKNTTNNALISPVHIKPETPKSNQHKANDFSPDDDEPIDIDKANLSPKKLKSLSYRPLENRSSSYQLPKSSTVTSSTFEDEKRAASDSKNPSRLKTLRTTSTQNFKSLTTLKKLKTSAFQEGIRQITPDDAIKSASYSGWMSKKSGSNIGWRSRYFTLHGTRLLYFTSLKDKKEKGLIDITAHKVIPINTDDATNSNDKYIAMYASSTGYGRYCFKIVPPAPGFKKGLTFTQPKIHFFAVETQEDMRGWLKALMTATIDIDDTVPVVSSCNTPTVTLGKAQELLAKAREETRLKDEELRAQGYYRGGYETYDPKHQQLQQPSQQQQSFLQQQHQQQYQSQYEQTFSSEENSPIVNEHQLDRATSSKSKSNLNSQPSLTLDTSGRNFSSQSSKTPTTPSQGAFASPYLLASGLLSPKSGTSSSIRDSTGTKESVGLGIERENSTRDRISTSTANFQNSSSGNLTQSPASSGNKALDFLQTGETTPKLIFLNSNGRVVSGSKKKMSEKMLAYGHDTSGNHSFTIKKK